MNTGMNHQRTNRRTPKTGKMSAAVPASIIILIVLFGICGATWGILSVLRPQQPVVAAAPMQVSIQQQIDDAHATQTAQMQIAQAILGSPTPTAPAAMASPTNGPATQAPTNTLVPVTATTGAVVVNTPASAGASATPYLFVDPAITPAVGTTTGFCPTRRQVDDSIFGKNADGSSKDIVVQVSSEPGGWQVNTGNQANFYDITLPRDVGLIATVHQPGHDQAQEFIGDGKQYQAFRGTFRFAGCYLASDDMNQPDAAVRILVKENYNGTFQDWMIGHRIQDWTFGVIPGNFTCPAGVCPTANVTGGAPASCPQFAGHDMTPGSDGAPYCKYKGTVLTGTVPSGWKAEYWNGSAVVYANAGDSIKAGEVTYRPVQ